jgi:serine/threonine protein kinase
MLKALAFLHEGRRSRPVMVGPPDCVNGEVLYHVPGDELDWMPILHRDIKPQNIHFQHPKGIETYGACKLGNYGRCVVSAHISEWAFRDDPRVLMATEEDDCSADLLRRLWKKWQKAKTDEEKQEIKKVRQHPLRPPPTSKTSSFDRWFCYVQSRRPYTRGSELFALGAILFRMMTGQMLPDPEECDLCGCWHLDSTTGKCYHVCTPDVDVEAALGELTDYTPELRELVKQLLCQNRKDEELASHFFNESRPLYQTWKQQTADGRLCKDILDDLAERQRNKGDQVS